MLYQKSCSTEKGVLRNLAKLTGKHLCWNLFFNKVAGFLTFLTEDHQWLLHHVLVRNRNSDIFPPWSFPFSFIM